MKMKLALAIAAISLASAANAQWSETYDKGVQVTPTNLAYDDRETQHTADGTTYIFFITHHNQTLMMRLQIIGKDGKRQLERGGLIISQEENKTWSAYNQHLMVDNDGNAIIAVQDFRHFPEQKLNTYTIYKYSKTGEKLWQGTPLEQGGGHANAAGLSMCCCDDGGYLFAYMYSDDARRKDIVAVEKLTNDGKSAWRKTIAESSYYSFPYPFAVNNGNKGAIVMHISGGSNIDVSLIDSDGNVSTPSQPTVYSNGFASPKPLEVAHVTGITGKVAVITTMDGDNNGTLTYVKPDGTAGFGTLTLNEEAYASSEPSAAYIPSDGTLAVAYKQFDRDNTNRQQIEIDEISLQGRVETSYKAAGTDFGSGLQYSYYSVRDCGNSQKALFYQSHDPYATAVNSFMEVYGKDGSKAGDGVQFTTNESKKQNLWASGMIDGSYFLTCWDEAIGDGESVFMQKIDLGKATSIASPAAYGGADATTSTFNLQGIKTNKMQKGINIVRTTDADGRTATKKILKK